MPPLPRYPGFDHIQLLRYGQRPICSDRPSATGRQWDGLRILQSPLLEGLLPFGRSKGRARMTTRACPSGQAGLDLGRSPARYACRFASLMRHLSAFEICDVRGLRHAASSSCGPTRSSCGTPVPRLPKGRRRLPRDLKGSGPTGVVEAGQAAYSVIEST